MRSSEGRKVLGISRTRTHAAPKTTARMINSWTPRSGILAIEDIFTVTVYLAVRVCLALCGGGYSMLKELSVV